MLQNLMTRSIASFLVGLILVGLTACKQTEFSVELAYNDKSSGKSLPYWPLKRIDLVAPDSVNASFRYERAKDAQPLIAQLALGNTNRPAYFLLAKSDERSLYYDLLYIDENRDFNFDNDGPPRQSRGQFIRSRNRHYTEFDNVHLTYGWQTPTTVQAESLLCKIYLWYPVSGAPQSAFVIRESWREGRFEYNKQKAFLSFVDDDYNGVFDANDRWAIVPEDSLNDSILTQRHEFRDVTRLGWLGETPFEVLEISPRGDLIKLVRKETELTREVDFAAESPYLNEPKRPKAARAIEWETSYNRAKRKARALRKSILAVFTTSWSGPSLTLEERTFSDSEIVSLSDNFVCLKIDGDKEQAVVERFKIQDYPTILFIDRNEKELSRIIGYQPAAEFSRLLKEQLKP